jgi:hypothetical protein
VSWGDGNSGQSGNISLQNSVLGTAAAGGVDMNWAFDDTYNQLVVGRPADNIVTLFRLNSFIYLPLVSKP